MKRPPSSAIEREERARKEIAYSIAHLANATGDKSAKPSDYFYQSLAIYVRLREEGLLAAVPE